MSEAQGTSVATWSGSVLARSAGVKAAIARAAQATGVDFQYLMAQARIESSLDAGAHAATSSAAGLFQFTKSTWLDMLGRYGGDHGMAWVRQVIAGGGLSDPGTRGRIMDLRYDADLSALMAAELASDNRAELTSRLGREPDATELYLAHFLGAAGAGQFLAALVADPTRSAAAILPAAAAANRAIFYEGDSPRSLGGVMDLLRGKMAEAMAGDYDAEAPDRAGPSRIAYQPMVQPGRLLHGAVSETAPAPARISMAETLRGAFNFSAAEAPASVRAAYSRLAGLGL